MHNVTFCYLFTVSSLLVSLLVKYLVMLFYSFIYFMCMLLTLFFAMVVANLHCPLVICSTLYLRLNILIGHIGLITWLGYICCIALW